MRRQRQNYKHGGLGKKISHEEAEKAAKIWLHYVEQQQHSTALDMMNIRKWRDVSFRKA